MSWDAGAALALVAIACLWLARGFAKPACARCPASSREPVRVVTKPCQCAAIPAERLTLAQRKSR